MILPKLPSYFSRKTVNPGMPSDILTPIRSIPQLIWGAIFNPLLKLKPDLAKVAVGD